MIDLHLHTTASDGTLSPAELVKEARRVGIKTLAVTDHDTMAGVPVAAEAASRLGLEFLPGVEITAVHDGRDVHVLAYFLDPWPAAMTVFLETQRTERVERARRIGARLDAAGAPIDVEAIVSRAEAEGRAVTRPLLARALVEAGHVGSQREAFDRWLADRRPTADVRRGATPAEVIRIVAQAGGITALAHPGLLGRDHLVPALAAAGLDALEVYHPDHDPAARARYRQLASSLGLGESGGSDHHGNGHGRRASFGVVGLPRESFIALLQRVLRAHGAVQGGLGS